MQKNLINLISGLFLTVSILVTHSAISEERNRIGQFFESSVKGVVLQGTSTLIFSNRPDPTAAKDGEAFLCEGDPEGDYQCSNSFATYGCSEECKCCYYEETRE